MIDISDIKVGDRVRVSKDTGDEAMFTVTGKSIIHLASASNAYSAREWDLIEKLTPPLPTKPGVYLPYKPVCGFIGSVWLRNGSGVWLNLPNAEGGKVAPLSLDSLERAHQRGSLVYLGTGQEQ